MSEHPIITRIVSQKHAGYRDLNTPRPVSIIENVGVDAAGQRWRFYSEYTWHTDERGMGGTTFERTYGYAKVSGAAELSP